MGKPWIRGKQLSGGRRERKALFPWLFPVSKTDVKGVQTHKKMNTNKSEQQPGNHSWKRSGLFRCGFQSGVSSCRMTLWSNYSLRINSLQLPPSRPQLRKKCQYAWQFKAVLCFEPCCGAKYKLFICLLSSEYKNSSDFMWQNGYSTQNILQNKHVNH